MECHMKIQSQMNKNEKKNNLQDRFLHYSTNAYCVNANNEEMNNFMSLMLLSDFTIKPNIRKNSKLGWHSP